MLAFSRECVSDGTHSLCVVCTGEFETDSALFIDILIHREALNPGTYTLAFEKKTWSFELPEAAVNQGFPQVLYGVQVDLRE